MNSAEHPFSPFEERLVALAKEHGFEVARKPVQYNCMFKHRDQGVIVYLNRQRTPRNVIAVFVHPDTDPEKLRNTSGHWIVEGLCHKAGLSAFPRKINKGVRPSPYGYSVVSPDLTAFVRLLDQL